MKDGGRTDGVTVLVTVKGRVNVKHACLHTCLHTLTSMSNTCCDDGEGVKAKSALFLSQVNWSHRARKGRKQWRRYAAGPVQYHRAWWGMPRWMSPFLSPAPGLLSDRWRDFQGLAPLANDCRHSRGLVVGVCLTDVSGIRSAPRLRVGVRAG